MTMNDIQIRELHEDDLDNGFLETLEHLTIVGTPDKLVARERVKEIQQNPHHKIYVASHDKEVIGSATLLIEPKFIHQNGFAGRIEDVVVTEKYAGKGIGKLLIDKLSQVAKEKNCYKITIECSDDLRDFYARSGFQQYGISMRKRP